MRGIITSDFWDETPFVGSTFLQRFVACYVFFNNIAGGHFRSLKMAGLPAVKYSLIIYHWYYEMEKKGFVSENKFVSLENLRLGA